MTIGLNIQQDIPLAPLTTLKIGGNARFFVRAETEKQVIDAFMFATENDFKLFVLGGGSNVLISDSGFDGLVLQVAIKGISTELIDGENAAVTVGAGEDWDRFVEFCVSKNFQGIECLSGIPGFVGGTPIQNVGAYGQEVSEVVHSVRCFDRKTSAIVNLTNSECKFAYRSSIFNTSDKERFIVISVKYCLRIDGKPKIVYSELRSIFDERIPDLKETRKAVLNIRAAKSMVIDANDINSRSAGSFFKNPVVSPKEFESVRAKAISEKLIEDGENIPFFEVDTESVKIPAAWLIEKSGFNKGFRLNNAGISSNHTLAIVNLGNATAEDVLKLKNEIQRNVNGLFGIELIPEPIFVGLS